MLAPFSLLFLLIALVNSQNLSYDQTAILLSLKQHWGNPPSLHSWNSLSSPCHWPQVECDSAGTAISLRLGDKNLKGTIPSAICQLKNLVSIELWMNKLSGPIPSCLDNCSNLEYLDLSINKLSGTIPSAICQLKNLVSVELWMNKLSGPIPSCLDNCSNLEYLDLSINKLSGIIPSALICQLRNLTLINLGMNKLSGHIPACLYNCSNLAFLGLSVNALSGTIPGELFLMQKLQYLSISSNRLFGGIPTPIQAYSLEYLDLSHNNLNGSIPYHDIRNLSNLTYLNLSINSFTGSIPRGLFHLDQLISLSLAHNNFSGSISDNIRNLYNLQDLDLHMNRFSGSIPNDISNLSNLIYLDLSMNLFSGSIPRGLFHIHQLNYMSLAYNNLTGVLPAELDLFNIQKLNLTHNHLHGEIPKSYSNNNNPYLDYLDLSNNQLSGGIVQSLYRLRSNKVVWLCSNNFSEQIPVEFVNRKFLGNCLDLSNLCSDKKTKSLPGCPSTLCSDFEIHPFLNCSNIEPDKNIANFAVTAKTGRTTKIIVEAIGCGVVGFVIFGYIARKCWKMAHATIASTSNIIFPSTFPLNKDKEWEMISFQKLDFDKSDILSSLTDENLIGNGGSGKVYRVVTNESGNTVAVKSIWNDKKTDERLDKEFMAEIQTLGTIRHNNIVKLLGYISGKNTQLLVYQYFANQSLDQWLHDNKREISPIDHCSITKLDWPMRLNIAVGVAQGLCYMHHHCSPPIIHRDIKSSNILLDSEFNAKIADFGMAKMLIRNEDPETASAVVGTFGYIAPEYAYTKRVNVKSDVYSFGVVLLELTTGRKAVRPDDHMNLAGWAQIHYRETAYVVDSLDDEIKESSFLHQIVAVFRLGVMCTTKTPANRPSMRDCLNILQDYSSCCSSSDSMS